MNMDEILSILAHEAGHWKKKHVLKQIIATEAIALIALYTSYWLIQYDFLALHFGIEENTIFAKVIVLAFLGSIVSFPFTPLFHHISRKRENEADRYSCGLTDDAESLISALVKLSKDNLSNLHPHPLYALFHYSHPPVLKRIRTIREMAGT
jgi:STE24 endopeptidase